MTLKEELINIKNNEYKLPDGANVESVVESMLRNIGSTDSYLRDELIYTTFSEWIIGEYLPIEMLRNILHTAMNGHHIFYHIGDSDSDSVFTRSFSMLLIPLILLVNQKHDFLSNEDIIEVKVKLIRYLQQEKDLRGYVLHKGWAHSIAHSADAINALAENNLHDDHLLQLLNTIKDVVCTKDTVYMNLEDERLTTAVVTILKKDTLKITAIQDWIRNFDNWERSECWQEEYKVITNVKNFLSSLYFRLCNEDTIEEVAEMIKETLIKMMKRYT
ncbi:DUF2785 domain-containing protein [Bacillus solimangrovi]|uniref:DUF2785 domain-containing protein n=1 Tax=Bacillus solimangrovi TaxID=1305675 RepID=A0A1E5LJ61_9BACI|nr:DUF2785 domain-containing protein [Bacillus solimangrovi]OEH94076.1 hypothetical protein BFG57_09520 [Bacillus solimangrovi]